MEKSFDLRLATYEYLSGFISENKKKKIEEIIFHRTKYLTIILEDIYQPHNASAVVRSCDCLGIQDIHIIENKNKYSVNPDVALGSSKWVNIIKYNTMESNTELCISTLKFKGYKIVATLPDKDFKPLEELELDKKTAIMFGTEMEGLSKSAIRLADESVRINMFGFTESLNISVSAALCIHYLSSKIRNSNIEWRLSEDEIIDTKLTWARNIVKHAELIEKDFLKRFENSHI